MGFNRAGEKVRLRGQRGRLSRAPASLSSFLMAACLHLAALLRARPALTATEDDDVSRWRANSGQYGLRRAADDQYVHQA